MKRILINATQQEELRVAIVDGQKLYNLDIEVPSKEQKKSSIFKGKVTRVEPSLEACFVEYGSERHGFLPFKEISKSYWSEAARKSDKRPSIKDAIKSGQEVVVQVEKEERGNKGAALTTKVSLAGRYSVLMPTEARAGGVSRRIEGEDRAQVRDAFTNVNKPENMGAIVRTAGVGRSTEELQWDLDYLTTLWDAISKAAEEKSAPFLIYHDSSVIIRALRDHYDKDIGQILIDKPEVFQQATDFVRQVMPHNLHKLKLYDEATPLFSRFQIESQIESAFQREVTLPSGGAIVIDHTEALTSIDINSGRATKGSDIEDTAVNTNLEAASEVARQLRLRDLGGLFVIDFIDMVVSKNQRAVENRLRDELKMDRARVRTSRISRFGLLELSRQRLRPSLGEASQEVCRVCEGHGTVRSAESLSLSILRLLGEEAAKDHTGTILAHLPVDVATFLLNEKRADIAEMEKLQKVRIVLVPDQNYERPHYLLERLKDSEKEHAGVNANSYDLVEKKEPEVFTSQDRVEPLSAQAAVQSVKIEGFAPPPQQAQVNQPAIAPEQPGLFVKLWKGLFGAGAATEETSEEKKTPQKSQQRRPQQTRGRHNNNQRGRGNQNRRGNQQNNQRNKPQQNNQQN
ncbi:MAG TPA: ribonuclease E/G, partial [Gammaproteobacteria bacterium]|nr:ribonuclease E/G [Gammaproteobacteria bacterium]